MREHSALWQSHVFPQEKEIKVHKMQVEGEQLITEFFQKMGEHNGLRVIDWEWLKLITTV